MEVKILTLNLLHGGIYFDAIEEFLKRENADIICLQEVYNDKRTGLPKNLRSIEVLRSIFPDYFYHFAPEILWIRKEGNMDMGNAIFSKYPIEKSEITFYDTSYGEYELPTTMNSGFDFSIIPRNLEYAQIKLENTQVNIFNTHGIWGFNGKDSERRLNMGNVIVKKIKNINNVLLCGDFNLFPNTQTIINIEKYLNNIFKNELSTTFNLKFKPSPGDYANAIVDMMFASYNVKIIKKYQPNVDVSDHFPLVCIADFS